MYIHVYIFGIWFALINTSNITEKFFVTPNMEDHLGECGTCPYLNVATPACRMHGGCHLLAMVATAASQSCSVAPG